MITCDYEIPEGTILPLQTLEGILRTISHDSHQWSIQLESTPRPDREGNLCSYAEIRYTNPELPGMPNEISLLFPVIGNLPGAGVEGGICVCLHPGGAIQLRKGLYFEAEVSTTKPLSRLLYDPLEDFYRLWTPLKEALPKVVAIPPVESHVPPASEEPR